MEWPSHAGFQYKYRCIADVRQNIHYVRDKKRVSEHKPLALSFTDGADTRMVRVTHKSLCVARARGIACSLTDVHRKACPYKRGVRGSVTAKPYCHMHRKSRIVLLKTKTFVM